jgi:bifunctional DNA-binding transcriptional regulator/antitoxin component of YhaV-PrlF toxin-antitoxin module
MEVAITRMSSKGQIVIPSEMRRDMKDGEKIFLIKDGNRFLMKRISELDKDFEEDLEFARKTEEAYLRHEKGDSVEMEFDDFIDEMKTW